MYACCPDTYELLEPGQTISYAGNPLLPDWAESVTFCVAMAGARASGKSLYLAVVIKQLELLAQQRFPHITIEPADESTRIRYQEKYEKPLYQELKHMPPTPTSVNEDAYQRDPFIFSLGYWPDPEGVSRHHYLVIRDVAGEDLENPNVDPLSMRFFKNCDLVIFLFDPLKVPSIATYLQGLIPTPRQLGGNPEDVFRNIVRLLGDSRPKLAVAVSKFDTLQELERLQDKQEWKSIMGNLGAGFRRDTGFNYVYHSQWVLHLEIQSLLIKLEADRLLNMMAHAYRAVPERLSYFAVSALGESPRGENLDRKGIAPYRVLDPLRWFLSERRVLM
ncbi:hypothetical protein CMUST_13650 [Corynebacterium mustelae]|uniref:Uncharacterized protein n=1 Tax=Corynebacterium mustelae TaxID=571915 RepID=A0A0G3H0S9_9CORY|nr:hypothetical protein [Corynebacterium mustelae]AKK07024.1 hypothetical protein CMUST_13650 [Corynebacterium mustelae]